MQEEVKAIAKEMRGTITLAHAVTSQASQAAGDAQVGRNTVFRVKCLGFSAAGVAQVGRNTVFGV
jgi:hypothetical protein